MGPAAAIVTPEKVERPSFAPSDRIAKLRALTKKDVPELCIERAVLFTQSYKETEGEPADIRRAKAFAKVLGEMTIYVKEGELVVGNQASKPQAGKLFPELGVNWLEKELDTISTRPQDPFLLSEEDKRILREEVIPYWRNRCVEARIDLTRPRASSTWRTSSGHGASPK